MKYNTTQHKILTFVPKNILCLFIFQSNGKTIIIPVIHDDVNYRKLDENNLEQYGSLSLLQVNSRDFKRKPNSVIIALI